ncbi:MAG: hypothetical protein LBL80_04245 [Ruminococcus sp.]|jgi:hypothetical protein|nr:hypothetical protein [Ruminococcus sp.]
MNITSMTGQELYKTLFGTDTRKKITDEASEAFHEANPPVDGRYDKLMVMTEENSEHIDPDTSSLLSLYDSGSNYIYKLERFTAPKSDEELAARFGDIGARLDAAYSEGKFTEDEYNELNNSLTELISVTKSRNDRIKAEREFNKEHPPFLTFAEEEKEKLTKEEEAARSAEWMAYRKSEIEKIIARISNDSPLDMLLTMINNYRTEKVNSLVSSLSAKTAK